MKLRFWVLGLVLLAAISVSFMAGCGSEDFTNRKLQLEEVDPVTPGGTPGDTGSTETGQTIPQTSGNGLHPMFQGSLGVPIVSASLGNVSSDPNGNTVVNDYDGDGIQNDDEVVTNAYVADYPRIVTRISAPITMEIRVSETSTKDNHVETVEDTDMRDTISNSMEDKQYAQANQKTTPYQTKESYSNAESHSEAYGFEDSYSVSGSVSARASGLSISSGGSASFSKSGKHAENSSMADSFNRSTLSEKTVFDNVDYIDNLDRNGKEFTNETVQKIVKNFRKNESLKNSETIGPNAGIVRAALFIKNLSNDMPVRVSNIVCTLSFRTPAGEFLPIKTFRLRNDDWSLYEQDIYGGDEFGPYTIEVDGLNTNEVKRALANGYIPQIHVVSYDLNRVADSNYNPGVDNLKIVEETAKSRTATIVIVGKNTREIFRVCAFDVDQDGQFSPGISLKKALFNIYRKRIGSGESWEVDGEGYSLTVPDSGLKWKADATDQDNYTYSGNVTGNSWDGFETYVKTYTDEYNRLHKIETIKRIGPLQKYNPFDAADNPKYNQNDPLSESEFMKMKYWVIYHDGRYYIGDINDPIWAGERYEIICFDAEDFNRHLKNFSYTPLQSLEPVHLDTRWNKLTNEGEYARARYLGKVIRGDVVRLDIDILESRNLFDPDVVNRAVENPQALPAYNANAWYDFNYTIQPAVELERGIPKDFSHEAAGGTNTIRVHIEKSELAHGYDVSFQEDGNPNAEVKVVWVSYNDFAEKNGIVEINRTTLDKTGNPVGKINGDVYYNVTVKALGICYNVPVTKNSQLNGQVRVLVQNPPAGLSPGVFSFNTVGYKNGANIKISEGTNTEYYRIHVSGPLNYESGEKIFIGHSGTNQIKLENPANGLNSTNDPGVYSVKVFAVNDNCMTGGIENEALIIPSSNQDQNIVVDFERYAAQKVYQPKLSSALADLKAIDLEVNFDDGSGWYRLRLSSNDNLSRHIDCRYTSYYENNQQKFHISFMAPSGGDYSIYNVFMGGRDEVDLYIRTVPKQEYRDTFWLKPTGATGWDPDENHILTYMLTEDFIGYWINSEETDATLFEETVAAYGFEGSPVPEGGLALADTGIADYFFSPLQRKIYRVKASYGDALNSTEIKQLDSPSYNAVASDKSIVVSGMDSQYADCFEVYWKPGKTVGPYEDINQYPWSKSEIVTGTSYKIANLTPNQSYVVGVVAYNQYGYSKPRFYNDTTDNGEINNIVWVIPYSSTPPAAPQGVSLNLGSDVKSIIVSNIHVPGEYKYKINWKKEGVPDDPGKPEKGWSSAMIGNDMNPNFNAQSYMITGLEYWERYFVKVCAVTGSGVEGAWTADMMVDTEAEGVDAINANVYWGSCGIGGDGSGSCQLKVHINSLPENADIISIDSHQEYNYTTKPTKTVTTNTSSWYEHTYTNILLNDYVLINSSFLNAKIDYVVIVKNRFGKEINKSFSETLAHP